MKINYVGVIASILAFISLALPWWTMTISASMMGITYGAELSVYPHQARVSAMGFSASASMNIWYGWVALALIIIGGILGIVGSTTKYGKNLIAGGGALALLSIIIFAAGLQYELSSLPSAPTGIIGISGLTGIGLFSSGTINIGYGEITMPMSYSTYLSYGFWIALISAILMFVATGKHPTEAAPLPPPEAPPPAPT